MTWRVKMHAGAAELIPELGAWNDGRGIDLESWANAVGRYDFAIAYATIFWPDSVIHDDCVFRYDPDGKNYEDWMKSLEGDRARVEHVMNHLHIMDMFISEGFEPTDRFVIHVAELLKNMWSCKLARDFPQRSFQIEIYEGTPDDLLGYEITFFQKRAT
jgi:hypothetical protein